MKAFNTFLAILATLAIVALSAFNTHRVGEQAKEIAELQQFHKIGGIVDTIYEEIDLNIWGSIDEAVEYRDESVRWESIITQWYEIPEISLRHILMTIGLDKGIEDIVQAYNDNITYYKAFEDGYLTKKLPDKPAKKAKEIIPLQPVDSLPQL